MGAAAYNAWVKHGCPARSAASGLLPNPARRSARQGEASPTDDERELVMRKTPYLTLDRAEEPGP